MKIVPRSTIEVDYDFPKNPTNDQIESVLFFSETGWGTPNVDREKDCEVLTFSDLKEYFDNWDQYKDFCEIYFGGVDSEECREAYNDDHYETVYDYFRDCTHWFGGAFWPVRITNEKGDEQ